MSVLAQIGSPEAVGLLKNLAEEDRDGDLGRLADAALAVLQLPK